MRCAWHGKVRERVVGFAETLSPAQTEEIQSRSDWFLLGLVVIARAKHPDPFRTRPLSAAAPMVLRLKTWESRAPPNLAKTNPLYNDVTYPKQNNAKIQLTALAV